MWFVLFFILLYALLHVYLLTKTLIAFSPSHLQTILLGVFLACMTVMPILEHVMERGGHTRICFALGLFSSLWMAVLFWACSVFVVQDLWNLAVRAAGFFQPVLRGGLIPERPAFSSLYVSRGAGTWGPPLRFFAPPEITLFTLGPD
ncbi:MAG: hypothetical protein V2A34_04890 [Lentisphaerota bacterium]